MAEVIMTNWREGLKKVSLTKLQTDLLKISLSEAHKNTSMLLDNIEITLEIEDINTAILFQQEADKIGVDCVLISK